MSCLERLRKMTNGQSIHNIWLVVSTSFSVEGSPSCGYVSLAHGKTLAASIHSYDVIVYVEDPHLTVEPANGTPSCFLGGPDDMSLLPRDGNLVYIQWVPAKNTHNE